MPIGVSPVHRTVDSRLALIQGSGMVCMLMDAKLRQQVWCGVVVAQGRMRAPGTGSRPVARLFTAGPERRRGTTVYCPQGYGDIDRLTLEGVTPSPAHNLIVDKAKRSDRMST